MGASVVDLGVHRRRRDEPSIEDARLLIEDFVAAMNLVPTVADHISKELGVILAAAVVDGNIDAARAWKRIEREIKAPIRAREHGEHGWQPLIDRVVVVVALAAHYRMIRR
jgi:hypothetical protein